MNDRQYVLYIVAVVFLILAGLAWLDIAGAQGITPPAINPAKVNAAYNAATNAQATAAAAYYAATNQPPALQAWFDYGLDDLTLTVTNRSGGGAITNATWYAPGVTNSTLATVTTLDLPVGTNEVVLTVASLTATASTTQTVVASVQPGSVYFDGSGQNFLTSDQILTNFTGAFTCEAWVKTDSPGYFSGWDMAGTGEYGNWFWNGDTELWFNVDSNPPSTVPPSTGAWHHVASVYDGNGNRFYFIDGVNAGITNSWGGWSGTGSGEHHVGAFGSGLGFSGKIAGFRVSLTNLYETTFEPAKVFATDSTTWLNLDFTVNGSTNVLDKSGNGYHNSFTGSPLPTWSTDHP